MSERAVEGVLEWQVGVEADVAAFVADRDLFNRGAVLVERRGIGTRSIAVKLDTEYLAVLIPLAGGTGAGP